MAPRTYETVVILDERKVREDGKDFVEDLKKTVQSLAGSILNIHSLGRKQFAREINKRKHGIYWDFKIEMEPDKMQGMPALFKHDERVLRLCSFIYERPENQEIGRSTVEQPLAHVDDQDGMHEE